MGLGPGIDTCADPAHGPQEVCLPAHARCCLDSSPQVVEGGEWGHPSPVLNPAGDKEVADSNKVLAAQNGRELQVSTGSTPGRPAAARSLAPRMHITSAQAPSRPTVRVSDADDRSSAFGWDGYRARQPNTLSRCRLRPALSTSP